MGCWDVNPRKSKRTPEEIERFIDRARALGFPVDEVKPRTSGKTPEDSVVLVDYLSLMQ